MTLDPGMSDIQVFLMNDFRGCRTWTEELCLVTRCVVATLLFRFESAHGTEEMLETFIFWLARI